MVFAAKIQPATALSTLRFRIRTDVIKPAVYIRVAPGKVARRGHHIADPAVPAFVKSQSPAQDLLAYKNPRHRVMRVSSTGNRIESNLSSELMEEDSSAVLYCVLIRKVDAESIFPPRF